MLAENLTDIISNLNDKDLLRLYDAVSDEKRKRDYAKAKELITGNGPNPLTDDEIFAIRKSHREAGSFATVKAFAESRGYSMLQAKRIVDAVLFGDD